LIRIILGIMLPVSGVRFQYTYRSLLYRCLKGSFMYFLHKNAW